jgi:hypothetical protein
MLHAALPPPTTEPAPIMRQLQPLVDQADVPTLLAAVDGLCSCRRWDDLVELARRCRDAIELGKQLWGVAMHVDYRLALEAPAPYAAAVLTPGASRFTLGPLTEVAAGAHPWPALRPHLDHPAAAATVAQERVLRGDDLRGDDVALGAPEDGLPLHLQPWEPGYALPVYRDRSAEFPAPAVAARTMPRAAPLRGRTQRAEEDAGVRALHAVAEPWASESSGRVRAVAVAGDAEAAVATLTGQAGLLQIGAGEALALLQWAGASGGAYGRRPGGAAGRFSAWWAAAALAGLEWPADDDDLEPFADDLGSAVAELSWYRWNPASGETGWVLRLAVEDPVDGMAWAVDATDQREADDADAEASDAAAG